jgi:methionyl-tRNA formyltransferase
MTLAVAVVTQDEPFYMPLFYRSFFSEVATDEAVDVEWITVLDLLHESFRENVQRAYRLYGPANFLQQGVGYAWRRLADAAGIGAYSVASVAASYDVPVEHRQSVNTSQFCRRIEDADVDVVLSVSASEIFGEELLDAPRWGCLNVHTSELPKYRGMLPTFWALYHGEDEVGVTVHTMAAAIDRGRALRQTTFPVEEEATLDTVVRQGKRTGGVLAAVALADIARGEESYTPLDGDGSYFSFPTVEERRAFQRRGGQLL